jgi:hypothetical protein
VTHCRKESTRIFTPPQKAAYLRIEELGGNVFFDKHGDKSVPVTIVFRDEKFTDAELPLLEPFYSVPLVSLGFVNCRVSDGGISDAFRRFPTVIGVSVSQMPAGDRALESLRGRNTLQDASFDRTRISSDGIGFLAQNRELESVSLTESDTDDKALASLKGLPKLKWLGLGKTRVSSEGLQALSGLHSLETLLLNHTEVDDRGIEHLSKIKTLTSLRLDSTRITDASCGHLAKLRRLKDLDIEKTEVSNEGLKVLQSMPALEELRWEGSRTSDAAGRRFLLYLPANATRWREPREKYERGELKLD